MKLLRWLTRAAKRTVSLPNTFRGFIMILHRFHLVRDEGGQGLTEYAFILMLVALVAIGILSFVGQAIADQFCILAFELSPKADPSSSCV